MSTSLIRSVLRLIPVKGEERNKAVILEQAAYTIHKRWMHSVCPPSQGLSRHNKPTGTTTVNWSVGCHGPRWVFEI